MNLGVKQVVLCVAFLCLARGTRGKEEGARREPQSNIKEEEEKKNRLITRVSAKGRRRRRKKSL